MNVACSDSRLAPRRFVTLVVLGMTSVFLLLYLDCVQSPNLDEVGHLSAGVLVARYGCVDLYEVNPPLVKGVAAIIPSAAGMQLNWSDFSREPGHRREWSVGASSIAKNGDASFEYFTYGRITLLLFWLVGIVAILRLSSRKGDAVAAVAFWCFNPEVLTWTATICPDSPASSLGVCCIWSFRNWLIHRSNGAATVLGVLIGISLLAKSSWLILLPVLPLVAMFHLPLFSWESLRQLAVALAISFFVVNAGYGFQRTGLQLESYKFFSESLAGLSESGELRRREPVSSGNRFAGTWVGEIPVPLPASFVEGLDLQKYDFEEGKWSYLRGEHKFGGWWYWYIYALMVKTPIGTILLFFITCGWALWRVEWKSLARSCLQRFARLSQVTRLWPGTRSADAPPLAEGSASASTEPVLHENLILLAPAVCLFVLVSSQTGFSRYLRYVLPCYPFVFIWMSQIFSEKSGLPAWMRKVCWGLLAWSVFSSLSVFPHSMSYFNELAGGPENGPAHLIDASIDWGQDVLFLADWVKEHPEAKPLYLSLHVFFDPRVAGIDYEHPPYDPRYARFRQHLTSDRVGPKPGWYAVSVHQLYSRTKEFAYLFDFPKADMVGYSIYLYHLTEQDVENWNRQHAAEIEAASGKPAAK